MAKKSNLFGGMSGAYGDFINQSKPKSKPVAKAPLDPAELGRYFGGVGPMPMPKTVPVNNVTDFSKYPTSQTAPITGSFVGDYDSQYVAPVAPVPEANLKVTSPVKIATPQYVNFDDNTLGTPSGGIPSLFFEQIAGFELLISNNRNFLNTANISYQPIINISDFRNTYDPKKIIALQDTSDIYFSNFIINLLTRIPEVPTSSSTNGTNVYITSAGNIVIETKDNEPDERVEIQILSGGTIYNDTLGVS